MFCSTYFEDSDDIGTLELRIYDIDNFNETNFKLHRKNQIKVFQFYRMQE